MTVDIIMAIPIHFCNGWNNTPLLNPFSLILFFLDGHPYTTCAFSQNLVEFPMSAISGLYNAMGCYITYPAIGILVVSDNGYFLFYSTVVFLYLECLGIAGFTGYYLHCQSQIAKSLLFPIRPKFCILEH